MTKLLLVLTLTVCGCGSGGAVGLAAARARCNESSPLTDAEWNDLVATHTEARDEGVSRDFAIAFGNLTCGGNDLCVRCNEALVDALWP